MNGQKPQRSGQKVHDPRTYASDSREVLARAIVKDEEIDIQDALNHFLSGDRDDGNLMRVHGIRVQTLHDAGGRVGTGVELHLTPNSWSGDPAAQLMEALQIMGKKVVATARIPLGPSVPEGPGWADPAPWPRSVALRHSHGPGERHRS